MVSDDKGNLEKIIATQGQDMVKEDKEGWQAKKRMKIVRHMIKRQGEEDRDREKEQRSCADGASDKETLVRQHNAAQQERVGNAGNRSDKVTDRDTVMSFSTAQHGNTQHTGEHSRKHDHVAVAENNASNFLLSLSSVIIIHLKARSEAKKCSDIRPE